MLDMLARTPSPSPSPPARRSAPDGGPVIRVAGLCAHYGARQVLHGIDLAIEQGEIMVIMGGSGSGKSTLLRAMVGLDRPSAGRIELFGLDITRARAAEMTRLRRRIGVAFQGGALFSSMTVLENLMLPLREHTRLARPTMEIMARMKLEVVGLAGFGDLMPAELSGGMLKRAAVARAIVMDPEMLFFDEPSAGLDPVVSAELDELILRLRDAMNMTIVVVTHELESTFKIADRITILDDGRILLVDDIAGVRASDNARIRNLLGRRAEGADIDAAAYLRRLTGEAQQSEDVARVCKTAS